MVLQSPKSQCSQTQLQRENAASKPHQHHSVVRQLNHASCYKTCTISKHQCVRTQTCIQNRKPDLGRDLNWAKAFVATSCIVVAGVTITCTFGVWPLTVVATMILRKVSIPAMAVVALGELWSLACAYAWRKLPGVHKQQKRRGNSV